MKRFLLAVEIPVLVALALAGAALSYGNGYVNVAAWFLCVAAYCGACWVILARRWRV